jgi:hypothetical protein
MVFWLLIFPFAMNHASSKNDKVWIKKSVGYQCFKSPAIPASCITAIQEIFPVWLFLCMPGVFKVLFTYEMMLLTLHF